MVPPLELKPSQIAKRKRGRPPGPQTAKRWGDLRPSSGDPKIDEKRRKHRDYVHARRVAARQKLLDLEKQPFCTPADIVWIFSEAAKFMRKAHADAA